MRKIERSELEKILKNHKRWLAKGGKGLRADLEGADLRGADLRGLDLRYAALSAADLSAADLTGANLYGATLRDANLCDAMLYCANLQAASLFRANLRGAKLRDANLSCTDLIGALGVPYIPMACPDSGAFVGWKIVESYVEGCVESYIVKLQIPEDARRSSATTTKCRCDKVLVLAIEYPDGTPCGKRSVTNYRYAETTYTVGEVVYPDAFDEDRWNECSHGIHFFINRQEAVNYR